MKILNLTQHPATPDQIANGVVDLPENERNSLCRLLTFETLPAPMEVGDRAIEITAIASRNVEDEPCPQAMIGGASYLMASLEWHLRNAGIEPVYAFSIRKSVEETAPDGSVV
jgi:hypothetical protein